MKNKKIQDILCALGGNNFVMAVEISKKYVSKKSMRTLLYRQEALIKELEQENNRLVLKHVGLGGQRIGGQHLWKAKPAEPKGPDAQEFATGGFTRFARPAIFVEAEHGVSLWAAAVGNNFTDTDR